MQLNISINLDNAAFEDNCDRELSDIFNGIVKVLQAGTFDEAIFDSNGNTVGRFTFDTFLEKKDTSGLVKESI